MCLFWDTREVDIGLHRFHVIHARLFLGFGKKLQRCIIMTDGKVVRKSALIVFVEVDTVEDNKVLDTNSFLSAIVRVSTTVLID